MTEQFNDNQIKYIEIIMRELRQMEGEPAMQRLHTWLKAFADYGVPEMREFHNRPEKRLAIYGEVTPHDGIH